MRIKREHTWPLWRNPTYRLSPKTLCLRSLPPRRLLEHPFFDAETETGVNKPFSDVNERVCKPGHEQDGSTALVAAAELGHQAVVGVLLSQPDVDVNAARSDGATALFIACVLGNSSCIPSLLAAPGIDVNRPAETGASAVLIAAVNGHVDCLALLLAHPEVDVNRSDEEGYTPIFLAASHTRSAVSSGTSVAGPVAGSRGVM
tara:strand:+ start:99 stop:707 length:609 start_codon:yes stop_codon:yes gene_type:complete